MHKENFEVYGIEKGLAPADREGHPVGRELVAHLMRELGLGGAVGASYQ